MKQSLTAKDSKEKPYREGLEGRKGIPFKRQLQKP
jgi:hypothetical protein